MVETKALSPNDRAAQVFPETVPPDLARAENQTKGPNGLIERQVTRELLELFNIDEQTLNTQGLVVTTTIDPQAQRAAEKAICEIPGRAGPRHACRRGFHRPAQRGGACVLRWRQCQWL